MEMHITVGQRIKKLRTHYNLGVKEFAQKCGLSHVAIFQMEAEKTLVPHRNSLQRIAMSFGTTSDWLLNGVEDMLPEGTKEIYLENTKAEPSFKEEIYRELKTKNQMLEKEVERLWRLIDHFTNDAKTDLQRLRGAG